MVHTGNEISICAIILLSIAMLFFPAQQGYGYLSPELNDEQSFELYKLKQIILAEQIRDEILGLQGHQNPYFDTASNVIAYFENDEKKALNLLERNNENFQFFKDKQIAIAEKKFKEILGGKTISNSLNDESVNKKSIHELKINNQTDVITRNSNDFQNYRSLQISIAEDFRDNNWGKMTSQESSNPYSDNKPISMYSSIEEDKILEQLITYRQSEKFKNSIAEQISVAENIRNEMLDFKSTGNPYMDENIDEPLDASNRNIIITDLPHQTFVTELEMNSIDRESKGFEMIQALEIKLAQNTSSEMYLPSNSEEIDDEIISLTMENKKLNDVERNDQGFEFLKNKEIAAAEKKLLEILGQKNIHNPDY